ncbi:hypothetical protein PVK06_031475 [Gossypium arboreum]|uniref:Uncharacterized protein n=1 Tax=Gossypium arboreum TaxID=29729 RepID=A0ABR0NTQ0_GOSAR|nr:hypothetical protein PVK06_031475 [Gossypium arboreum]
MVIFLRRLFEVTYLEEAISTSFIDLLNFVYICVVEMFLDSRGVVDKGLEINNLQTYGSEPSIDLRVTRNVANDVFVKMMERWFRMLVCVILSYSGIDGRLLDFDYERCINWIEKTMRLLDRKAFEGFVTTLWNIWNSRNNALFWGNDEDAIVIWDRAKTLASDFRVHNFINEKMIPKTYCTQHWEKPPNCFPKVNIDAAVVDDMIGFGDIMHNCD